MELVLGFTQINYNFGHHFVSLELLTIHRNLINCHVKVVAHTLGRLYVLLLTLRPCFGVANANLVLLLHWEQIHVVFLWQYKHIFWFTWFKILFPLPLYLLRLLHLFLFVVKWGPKSLAINHLLASASSLAWWIASRVALAVCPLSIISSSMVQRLFLIVFGTHQIIIWVKQRVSGCNQKNLSIMPICPSH